MPKMAELVKKIMLPMDRKVYSGDWVLCLALVWWVDGIDRYDRVEGSKMSIWTEYKYFSRVVNFHYRRSHIMNIKYLNVYIYIYIYILNVLRWIIVNSQINSLNFRTLCIHWIQKRLYSKIDTVTFRDNFALKCNDCFGPIPKDYWFQINLRNEVEWYYVWRGKRPFDLILPPFSPVLKRLIFFFKSSQ